MLAWLKRNFLMVGIVAAACTGVVAPRAGTALCEWRAVDSVGLVKLLVFIIFICSGLQLKTGAFRKELGNVRALVFALLTVNVVFPAVALGLATLFNISSASDAFIGLMVIASAPPTLASGIIITGLAGGSIALAIMLTLVGNISAVILMPIALRIILSLTTDVPLDVLGTLLKLFCLIVVPTALGYWMQQLRPGWIERVRPQIRFIPNLAIVMIVFMIVSNGHTTIRNQSGNLLLVAVISVMLHVILLAVNRLGARLLGLDLAAAKALTFVASQKTLPVSAAVVEIAFPSHPAALVPCIVFHILQIVLDSMLAERWRKKTPTQERS